MKRILLAPSFLSLFAQNFLFFAGLNIFNVLPASLETLGASKTYIGLFMNVNSLALVLLVVPMSRFTDRIGRKKLLLSGYALALVSLALSAVFYRDLVWLLLFRVGGVFAFCMAFTLHGAEVFEIVPKERRVMGIAIFGVSGLLTNPVSSFLGETVLRAGQPQILFWISFAFLASAAVLAAFFPYRKPDGVKPGPHLLRLAGLRHVRPLLLLTLVFGGCFSVYATFLANLTKARFGEVNIFFFFTSFSIVAVVSRLFLSRWLDRLPKKTLIVSSFLSISVSFGLALVLFHPLILVPMGILYGLGHSILFPVLSTLFVNSGGEDEKLGFNNLFSSVNTLGNFLWGFFLGALGDAFGIGTVFAVMGIAALSMAFWKSADQPFAHGLRSLKK